MHIPSNSAKKDKKSFFSLPPETDAKPSLKNIIASYFLAFIPWLIVYEIFIYLGAPADAIKTNIWLDKYIPIWEFSQALYLFAYVFSMLIPFVLKSGRDLRNLIKDIWFTILFVAIIYSAFPLIVDQKQFVPHTFLGRLILIERTTDGESGALPSCHVIWAFLSAFYFSKSYPGLKWLWYFLALMISVSCLSTGAHSILDVVAGFFAFLIVIFRHKIWNLISVTAENLFRKFSKKNAG
jgi:membrane-associated phospholipid phosphatase